MPKVTAALLLGLLGCGPAPAPDPRPDPVPVAGHGEAPTPAPDPEPVAETPQETPAEPRMVVVSDPGLEARFADASEPAPTVRLRRSASVRNEITDDERWLGEHDIGHRSERPAEAPETIGGEQFLFAIASDPPLAAYGQHYSCHYLWLPQPDGGATVLDLRSLYVNEMQVNDARRVGDRVYITRAHRTYASATDGKNASLIALDASSGSVVWVTEPLTSNVVAFTLRDRVIFTGYGFTDEPDHLYAIDRLTGRRLAELALRKGPSYLVLEGDDLHVRTYDRDVTVTVQVR